jgi:hypothetical protein
MLLKRLKSQRNKYKVWNRASCLESRCSLPEKPAPLQEGFDWSEPLE